MCGPTETPIELMYVFPGYYVSAKYVFSGVFFFCHTFTVPNQPCYLSSSTSSSTRTGGVFFPLLKGVTIINSSNSNHAPLLPHLFTLNKCDFFARISNFEQCLNGLVTRLCSELYLVGKFGTLICKDVKIACCVSLSDTNTSVSKMNARAIYLRNYDAITDSNMCPADSICCGGHYRQTPNSFGLLTQALYHMVEHAPDRLF